LAVLIGGDGGGSGCRVAIADLSGTVLAQAAGGPANVTSDFEGAVRNLRAALSRAAGVAGVTAQDLAGSFAHFGLAGAQSAAMGPRVAHALGLPHARVTEDRLTAVVGALGFGDGALVALGTGTIIAAVRAGTPRYAGGWGLALSDEASGAWLGRGLLARILHCHDGLVGHSDLTRQVFADFSDDPGAVVRFAASARPADYARHAPDVVAAAQAGDGAGIDLMQRGAEYIQRALATLGVTPNDALCLTGGVGPHYAPWLDENRQAMIVPATGGALDGALALARVQQMQRHP
jgi:glucosamine kinase